MKAVKSNKTLMSVIVALIMVVTVLAYINRSQLVDRQALVDNPAIAVSADGEEVAIIPLNDLRELGEEEFSIILRSSGQQPREILLTGVPLNVVLEKADPSLLEYTGQVVARAIDGYSVAYAMEEVLMQEHLFLVYLENGEPLGSKAEGGSGPLMMVPRQDEFGQRWCKFVVEVDIN